MLIERAYAATSDSSELIRKINQAIIEPIIALLFALAVVYFLWGVFVFVRSADDEEGRKTGGRHILWGLIGMFIMISVFGIMRLILNTIGADTPPGTLPI